MFDPGATFGGGRGNGAGAGAEPVTYGAIPFAVDRTQGAVNPDGLYHFAGLRPDRSYRIYGRRGNDCYLSLSFSGGTDGGWPERTVATRNDRQLGTTDNTYCMGR